MALANRQIEEMQPHSRIHEPVMAGEIRTLLGERGARTIVDATVGTGGHSLAILETLGGEARLLGIDRDARALVLAAGRLARFGERAVLRHGNFADIDELLDALGWESVDAILADLGMSSFALDDPDRGFSFRREGPLDMRMDSNERVSAHELVNEEGEAELARIIYSYGEERASRRIARAIVQARRRRPLETTRDLRAVIEGALRGRRSGTIHPATRTFQALRIAVNHEIESLEAFIQAAPARLAPGGRMIVIAYHSLEDRPVKERFRSLVRSGEFLAVTGKAMRPGADELARNPRARSARLRCIERGGR
jgi:16S rRNA (cytosine1402-N4)-methyltransferase